jgi:hypothetical protein
MQDLMEIADLALITIFSLSFALLLQWLALEGVFRFLQSPVQDRVPGLVMGDARKPERSA